MVEILTQRPLWRCMPIQDSNSSWYLRRRCGILKGTFRAYCSLSLLLATGLYIVIQIVATGTFPGLATSDKPLADAARYFMGTAGGVIIGAGALLSIGGINAGIALTSPRSLYVLSADGFFPKIFSKIHPQYHTPYLAIIVNTALTLFY